MAEELPLNFQLVSLKSHSVVSSDESASFQVHGQNEKFILNFRQLRLLAAKIADVREKVQKREKIAQFTRSITMKAKPGRRFAVMRDDVIGLNFSSPPFS